MQKTINLKNILISLISFILLIVLLISAITQPTSNVFADEVVLQDSEEIKLNNGLYFISDENLYNALINEYNKNNLEPIKTLTVGTFKSFPSLDLSGCNIESLVGLQYFKFNNLTSLNLSDNNIAGTFANLDNLINIQSLDLSNNKITNFDGKFATNLKNINLKNNKLIECDISTLVIDAVADLSFNYISSFENLVLPNNNTNLNLTHNLLVDNLPTTTCQLNMGFQGVKNEDFIEKGNTIKFYGLDNVAELKIYKKQNDNYVEIDNLIAGEELSNITLGYYKLEFVETGADKLYLDIEFTCRPIAPIFELWQDGKKLDKITYNVGNPTIIKFVGDGEIYYQINNGDVIKSNEYSINSYGNYVFQYWLTEDGMESEKITVMINSNYIPPMTFVWIILGVLAFVVFFYLGGLYKKSFSKQKTSSGQTIYKGFE